jgi:hypothetical protein
MATPRRHRHGWSPFVRPGSLTTLPLESKDDTMPMASTAKPKSISEPSHVTSAWMTVARPIIVPRTAVANNRAISASTRQGLVRSSQRHDANVGHGEEPGEANPSPIAHLALARRADLPEQHHDARNNAYNDDHGHDQQKHPDAAATAPVRRRPRLADAVVPAPVSGVLRVSERATRLAHSESLPDRRDAHKPRPIPGSDRHRPRHFLLGAKIGGRATVEGWKSGLTQRSWR